MQKHVHRRVKIFRSPKQTSCTSPCANGRVTRRVVWEALVNGEYVTGETLDHIRNRIDRVLSRPTPTA